MDEIEKAAREGEPLTDAMIRNEGQHCCGTCVHRGMKAYPTGPEDIGYDCAKHPARLVPLHYGGDCADWELKPLTEEEIRADLKRRREKINRENLEKSTTCVKTTDPDTFKPMWSLWTNGMEVLRLDPEAVQNLMGQYGSDALPTEIKAIIEWMERLSAGRAEAPAENFAGKAGLVPVKE